MNQLEYKIHNLEASILYIQDEHAKILKMLHEEIKDLQMKNSELSFHMAMQDLAVTVKSREPEDFQNLLEQIKDLQSEVSRLSSENSDKLKQIDGQETKIRLLTSSIDKLKESQREQMSAVKLELNNKSAEIVLLSTKLHNWKKLEVGRPIVIGDEAVSARSSSKMPLPSGPPTPPGVSMFKLRNNQISVHQDDGHMKNRPTVARHTLISASYPVKTSTVHLSPESAVSQEEYVNFSKLIRRPNILPPINTLRNRSPSDSRGRKFLKKATYDSLRGSRDSSVESVPVGSGVSGHDYDCYTSGVDTTETNNHNRNATTAVCVGKHCWTAAAAAATTEQKQQQQRVQVDIDRVMDIGSSPASASSLATPPIGCSAHQYHSSSSSSF